MKDYSDNAIIPNRVVLPIVEQFPHTPLVGEILYFNQTPREGIYIFDGIGWKPMFSTENNIWESFVAEPEQYVFELENHFNTDGKSIVIYQDGVRLPKNSFAEVGSNILAWKGEELLGGEFFEVQIFNRKITSVLDVKAFNRRKGNNYEM
jgi:hypothetical protein